MRQVTKEIDRESVLLSLRDIFGLRRIFVVSFYSKTVVLKVLQNLINTSQYIQ